ncbi:MAG: DUF5652 family protein [Candidatus Staskawiczbacteria bacterium]|nr:DUF5652 family protein [Candidatus Staskawiczbacteria bacterium]
MTPKEQQLIDFARYLDAHPLFMALFIVLGVWALVWKGIALWKAGRNNQLTWFVFIMILNTVGILPIIYLFFFSKKKDNQQQ